MSKQNALFLMVLVTLIWSANGLLIKLVDWVVTAVIMGGMLLFFGDNLTVEGFWGNISAILSAVCWAVFVLSYRKEKDDAPLKIPIIGHIICTLGGLPFIIHAGWWPAAGGVWIIPMGAVGAGLSFVLYTWVIRRLEAIEAVITQTIEPVFNPVWVLIVVGEKPGSWAFWEGASFWHPLPCMPSCAITAPSHGGKPNRDESRLEKKKIFSTTRCAQGAKCERNGRWAGSAKWCGMGPAAICGSVSSARNPVGTGSSHRFHAAFPVHS